jgi:hypothetical protein
MPKIEITLTDEEKRRLVEAAERSQLRPATWAKAQLLLAALAARKAGESQ